MSGLKSQIEKIKSNLRATVVIVIVIVIVIVVIVGLAVYFTWPSGEKGVTEEEVIPEETTPGEEISEAMKAGEVGEIKIEETEG